MPCGSTSADLLVDETYRDLSFDGALPQAASLSPKVISVSSLSKAYGVPGIRIGWLVTRDPGLQTIFLAAKEQISISGSVIDEWIAEQVLCQSAPPGSAFPGSNGPVTSPPANLHDSSQFMREWSSFVTQLMRVRGDFWKISTRARRVR